MRDQIVHLRAVGTVPIQLLHTYGTQMNGKYFICYKQLVPTAQ